MQSASSIPNGKTIIGESASWRETNNRAGLPHLLLLSPRDCGWMLLNGENAMPLFSEVNSKAIAHSELKAIGFWMTEKGGRPVQPVRVFVSYEALADLDPTNIRDLAAAFEHFEAFRARVEAAASDKFDRIGPDAEKYEGMPTIRLTTSDPL